MRVCVTMKYFCILLPLHRLNQSTNPIPFREFMCLHIRREIAEVLSRAKCATYLLRFNFNCQLQSTVKNGSDASHVKMFE